MKKEKIIQIAFKNGDFNPTLLTSEGRLLTVDYYTNRQQPRWVDITPDLTKV